MQNQINVRKRHPARTRAENRPPIQQVIFNFFALVVLFDVFIRRLRLRTWTNASEGF